MHSSTDRPVPVEPVERTLQLPGGSSFSLSLPKEWVLENDLEAGMSMAIYPYRDRLVVAQKPGTSPERVVTIDLETLDATPLSRRIRSAYLTGCTRIVVTTAGTLSPAAGRTIRETVTQLLGIEINRETDDTVVVETILDPGEGSIPQAVDQLHRQAVRMHETAIEAATTGSSSLARHVRSQKTEVDRLFAFVSHTVHCGITDVTEITTFDIDRAAAFRQYRIACQLDSLAAYATRIATVGGNRDSAPDPGPDPKSAFFDRLEALGADIQSTLEVALEGESDTSISRCFQDIERLESDLTDGTDNYLSGVILENLRGTVRCGIRIEETARQEPI